MRKRTFNYYSWTKFFHEKFSTEGPFQSDALLVPEGCLFDHIHNASRCWPFVRWNQTGATACQERNMQMRSFAMLLPCGISLFSGVEFVCCPKHFKGETFFYYCYFHFCARHSFARLWHKFIRDKCEVALGKELYHSIYFPFAYRHFSVDLSNVPKSTLTTFFIYSLDTFQFIFELFPIKSGKSSL